MYGAWHLLLILAIRRIMSMSFAIPSLAQRRASPVASIAFYAHWLSLGGALPMCMTCGLGTGNWCDHCEDQGHTFTWEAGGWYDMVGKPFCTRCEEDDLVVCRVCAM